MHAVEDKGEGEVVQSINCAENPRMHALWAGILNTKFCACVNSHHNFWTTNLKSTVVVREVTQMQLAASWIAQGNYFLSISLL